MTLETATEELALRPFEAALIRASVELCELKSAAPFQAMCVAAAGPTVERETVWLSERPGSKGSTAPLMASPDHLRNR